MYYFISLPNLSTYCGALIYSTCTSLDKLFLFTLPLVLYQVYQRPTSGNTCWLETNICRNFTEPVGSQQLAHVEAFAVQCGLSPHCCAGTIHSKVMDEAEELYLEELMKK